MPGSGTDLFDWSDLLTLTNTHSAGLATNYLDAIGAATSQKYYRLRLP